MNFGHESVPLREYIKPENLRRQLKVFGLMGEKDQLGFANFTKFLNKTIDELRTIRKQENVHLETVYRESKESIDKMAYLDKILSKHKARMRKLEKLRKGLEKTLMDVLVLKQETTDMYMKAHFTAEKMREALNMENITPWSFKKLIARHHNLMGKVKANLAKLNNYEMKYNPEYLKSEMEAMSSAHEEEATLIRLEAEVNKRAMNRACALTSSGLDDMLLRISPLRTTSMFGDEQPGPSRRGARNFGAENSSNDSDLSDLEIVQTIF